MPEISYREASRIQVLEAPRMNPGTCVICGAARTDDRDYLDFGLTIDFYGVVYFCTLCFQEVCNHLGFLTKEQVIALEEENDRFRMHILQFKTKEAALDDAISKLRSTGLLDISSSDDLGNDGTNLSPRRNIIVEDSDGNQHPFEDYFDKASPSSSKQRPPSVPDSGSNKPGNLSI
jgi:hypothetical protein